MSRKDVEKARTFATRAHKGQVRKGTRLPYIDHPLRVAKMLEEMGASEDAVIAGLLHDTTEDTPVSLEQIRGLFGEAVAEIVCGASESDKSLPWETRKKETIERMRTAALEVTLVSAADKIDNLRATGKDLEVHGESVWVRFRRGRDLQAWYHRSVLESFRANPNGIAAHPVMSLLDKEVRKVFGKK